MINGMTTAGREVARKMLYAEREAAKLLSLSPRKLQQLRKANRIPFCKVDGSIRYPHAGLEAFITSVTVSEVK